MTSRRQILFSGAALSLAAVAPRLAFAADATPVQQLNALFDEAFAKILRQSPEATTSLGLDSGDLAWTKGLLSDRSPAAIAANQQDTRDQLARLRGIDRKAISGMDGVNYDTVDFVLSVQSEGDAQFAYGGGGSGAPYIISQLTGSYQSMPDFLDTQHGIETKQDADDFLARMVAFARLMDQESELAAKDFAMGVIPPDFIIDKTLIQMKAFAGTPTDKAPLVESITRRTAEKKIAGDYKTQASKVYEEVVLPALKRQIALLESVRGKAVHDAGVWRLPKGEAYYTTSLKNYTTAAITPDEIHQLGLDMVAELSVEADKIMKSVGLKKGTVGERYRLMYEDAKYHYANTDEAKEKLLGDLNAQIKVIQAKLPAYFGALPKSPVEVRRVPKAIEAGAPGGYYNSPSLDGKRPGIYWINLRDTAENPTWTLPTLTYHEAIPGHHMQISIANEAQGLPMIRKLIGFSGYQEGWALYAEQLAVEMGMYDKDPLGKLGMIHDAMFRGVRLVVDSGMHHKKWSREQAVKYFVDTIGDQEVSAITEVERYVVWPGQACSYMVGKIVFLRLREKAKKALGKKFDIRAFHDACLLSGATPLTVLEQAVDNYIATAKG